MSLKGVGGKLEIVLETVGVGAKGSELGRVGRRETSFFFRGRLNKRDVPAWEKPASGMTEAFLAHVSAFMKQIYEGDIGTESMFVRKGGDGQFDWVMSVTKWGKSLLETK